MENTINSANNAYLAGDYAQARELYEAVLAQDADNIQALHNLGLACYNLGDYLAGERAHDRAWTLGFFDSLICRGNCRRALERFDEALQDYAIALTTNPESASAFNNYGNTLRELGRPRLAIPFLQAAQILNPADSTAFFNESVAHLLAGDLEKGWDAYETRWNYETQKGRKPEFNGAEEWTGEQDLQGKIILVYGEQGFGDAIQFVRYVRDLEAKGAQVLVAVRQELVDLFKRMDTRATILSNGENIPGFHYHIPILSLPRAFKTTLDTIPTHAGYIKPDQLLFQQWRKDLGLKKKMRVGICWTGNRTTWINRYKAMTLDQMLSVIDDEHEFICLQADATPEELDKLKAAGVRVFNDRLTDFNQTAALIAGLDVVISVDTAVAHLSGALGVDTWIPLNAYGTDWRWLLERNTNPWYHSVRLFRQSAPGDWSTCLDTVKKRLKLVKI